MKRYQLICKCFLVFIGTAIAILIVETIFIIKYGTTHSAFNKINRHYYNQIYEPIAKPFFNKKVVNGEELYSFARRQAINRPPIKAVKPKNEVRIVIAGESVAAEMGMYSSRDIERILAPRFPGRNIKVINAGMHAYNSTRIVPIVKDIVHLKPDIVLILMGNNNWPEQKRIRRLIRRPPPLKWLYLNSWCYYNIINFIYAIGKSSSNEIDEFARDYKDIAEILSKNKIVFTVFILPYNEEWPDYIRGAFAKAEYLLPWVLTETGYYHRALGAIKSEDGMLWFLKGKALMGLKKYKSARAAFRNAREINFPYHRSKETNLIARNIAKEYKAVLIDTINIFEDVSEGYIGNDFFIDDVHWYPTYSILLMDNLVRKINMFKLTDIPTVPDDNLLSRIPFKELKENVNKDIKKLIKNNDNRISIREGILRAILDEMEFSVHVFRIFIRYKALEDIKELLNNPPDKYKKIIDSNITGKKYSISEMKDAWYRVLTYAGEAFRREGKLEIALKFFNAAIERKPEAWEPYFFRSLIGIEKRQHDKAMQDLYFVNDANGYNFSIEKIIQVLFKKIA